MHAVEIPEAAVVIDAILGPQRAQYLDGFVGARAGFVQRDSECIELDRLVAAADADIDAPSAQHVDERDLFGDSDRVMERKRDHGGAETDALGERRGVGRHRHRVGQEAVVGEVVLAHPAGVESEAIGRADQRQFVADGPMMGRADALTLEQMIGRDALGVGEHERVERREFHGIAAVFFYDGSLLGGEPGVCRHTCTPLASHLFTGD